MARTRARERVNGKRAAIYARVSDKSQAEDDKTSISEQTGEMEAYCEQKGMTITARYQEVGRGWSKKRPEFQRMLADARRERFDTIVCWKSDRLSRGMYPAAALMEVVEAHQIQLEAVMDAIDMKTFGLMAAIGKIELDNFRERSTMGKRGSAKQGPDARRSAPYGYRTGDDGKPEICEPEAEVVRRIFHMYVHEGMGGTAICDQMTSEDAPLRNPGSRWHKAYVSAILGREVYKGAWHYGKARWVVTEAGERIYPQPEDRWIKVPFPPLVDEETWDRAQAIKKAADGAVQAQHQDILSAPAPRQLRRVRVDVRLPLLHPHLLQAEGQGPQAGQGHPSEALPLLRDAQRGHGLPEARNDQGRTVGEAGVEPGQGDGPEPRAYSGGHRVPRRPR